MKCLLRLFNPVPVALSVARAAHPDLADASGRAGDKSFGIDNNDLDSMCGAFVAYQCLASLIVLPGLYFYDSVLCQCCRINSTGDVLFGFSSACNLKSRLGKTVTRIECAATKAATGKSPRKAIECFYANWFGAVNGNAPVPEIKERTLLLRYFLCAKIVSEVRGHPLGRLIPRHPLQP